METSESNERAKLKVAQPLFAGKKLMLLFLVGATLISVGIARMRGCGFDTSWLENAIPSKPAVAVSAAQSPEAAPVQKAPSFEHLKQLPVSQTEPARFRGIQKTLVVPLKPGEWSREIVIPINEGNQWVYWTWRVDPPAGYFVWYPDGSIQEVTLENCHRFSLPTNYTPFRLLGKAEGQKSTITMLNKPPKSVIEHILKHKNP